jgi:hypothetical protein
MELVGADVVVDSGQKRVFGGPVFVNGWVTVRGSLECAGDLHCLGMTLAGSLKCRELMVNVLEALPGAALEVLRVRARVVHHTRLALRDAVDADTVKADYIQHLGEGAAPDYVRGRMVFTPDFYEERAAGAPVVFEDAKIREAFRTGKSVFKSRDFLVAPKSKAVVTAAARDPVVEELSRWLDMHPGPQRATIEAVGAEWLPRLTGLSAEARADAMFVIRRAIKSPKLVDLVEAIGAALADTQAQR